MLHVQSYIVLGLQKKFLLEDKNKWKMDER